MLHNLLSKIMDMLVGETPEESDVPNAPMAYRSSTKQEDNIIPLRLKNSKQELRVFYPATFADVQQILDSLLENHAVIVNFVETPVADRQRFLDFLGGALYALKGNSKKISESIFVFSPRQVPIKDIME